MTANQEFTQLDLEMSFVTQEDVFDTIESIMRGVFEEFGQRKAVTPKFPRIPYAEAMRKYGTEQARCRPAQPDRNAGRDRAFPRLRLQDLLGMIDMDANTRIWHCRRLGAVGHAPFATA